MPKRNYGLLDVVAAVRDINQLGVGYRVANLYDIDLKTYLFKLQKKDCPKLTLIMESGVRFHTTKYVREKSPAPSPFSMKLRKYIRTRILYSCQQLGSDRVVDFSFGKGEACYHLILEMYDKGNIILTDYTYEILALLRSHTYDEETKVVVGGIYPVDNLKVVQDSSGNNNDLKPHSSRSIKDVNETLVQEYQKWLLNMKAYYFGTNNNDDTNGDNNNKLKLETKVINTQEIVDNDKNNSKESKNGAKKRSGSGQKKKKNKKKISLLQILLNRNDTSCPYEIAKYGPVIVEHCLLSASIDGRMAITGEWNGLNSDETTKLLFQFESIPLLLQSLKTKVSPVSSPPSDNKDNNNEGIGNNNNNNITTTTAYVTYHTLNGSTSPTKTNLLDNAIGDNNDIKNERIEIYDEFLPILLKQHENKTYKTFPTFNSAVDEFFSKSEAQKAAKRHNMIEAAAKSKLVKMKKEQEDRIQSLKVQEISSIEKAQAIEANYDNIDKARLVVNSAIANGIDWEDLKELVKFEKSRNNPIASLIVQLKLDINTIILDLPGWDDDGNEKKIRVPIDVSMTAYQNARKYYQTKKQLKKKVIKTKEAAESFLSNAEENIQKEMVRAKNKLESTIIRQARKIYWFEKFDWFISSENYLVVLGRDMQQNEQLVKRYMRKGDVYVHADVHGASSCIVRNNDLKKDIPPLTLEEAGHMCMCRSSAWKSRTITSAWWVYHNQVSKTAPSGEYLTTGSFMIRGKKNFLRPSRLEVGYGLLFCVDEEDIQHHVKERVVRGSFGADNDDDDASDGNGNGQNKKHERNNDDNEKNHADKLRRFERKLLRKQQEEEQAIQTAANEAYTESVGNDSNEIDISSIAGIKDIELNVTPDADNASDGKTENMDFETDTKNSVVNEILNRKPGISRYQRKVMRGERKKKKKTKSNVQEINDNDEEEDGDNDDDGDHLLDDLKKSKSRSHKNSNVNVIIKKEKVKTIPRGKKGKLKKIKKKYKDQDEEERRIRMKALGNPMPEPKTESEVNSSIEVDETGDKKESGKSKNNNGKRNNNRVKQSTVKVDDSTPLDLPEEQLRALTATPRAEDTILFCLPVSAPYSTMSKYKYKVKLTPGSQRRGRSCKAVMQYFLQNVKEGTTKREKELIRAVNDAEAIAAMVSDVQINTSKAAKMSKKMNKGKKQKGGGGGGSKKKKNGGKKKKR